MKTLVISDLVTMRSALAQMAGICLLVYVFISFATQSIVAGAAAVAVMVPFMYFFTVSTYDETHNWELFRLTLPMTRRQVVFGRYASLLVVIAASLAVSFAFGVLLALAAGALAGSLGVVVPEGLLPQGDFVPVIFGAAVMPVVIMLVACSLALPLVLRYGVTKGTRLVPVAVVLIMAFAIYLVGDGGLGAGALEGLEAWLAQGSNLAVACGLSVAASLVLYGASACVAARLYERREL